jgi:bifunctional DNA primase/polymerase-like protein/AAA domain-containing protein/primase-like protein
MDSVHDSRHEAALRHAESGYRIFPCSPRDKRPLTPNGFHDATTDADTIRAWAEKHPGCLWGTPDGLVLDVDTHEGGADGYTSYRELADEHGDGGGVSAETRSGGLHLWYSNPDALPRKIGVRPGLDVCGDGGYAILWRDDLPPLSELPAPPAWIAELVQGRENGSTPAELSEDGTLPLGTRHAVFTSMAGTLRARGANAEEIEAALLALYLHRCPERPAETKRHVRQTAKSYGAKPPGDVLLRLDAFDGAPAEVPPDETSSWLTFLDLLAFDGLPPPTPEISGLFYCGHRNLVSGPSESGKTWAALAAAVDEISAGRDVLWIDTDGMGEPATLERLLTLGATREAIRDHFRYIVPSDKLTRPVLDALLESLNGRLVVVDSFNATMGLHGLSFKEGDDVNAFWNLFDPFCAAGWAVVVLDHVTKAAEGRGPYAIGSERKQSGAHSHLGFTVVGRENIVREGTGRSAVAVNKDRGAYFERPTAGIFTLTINDGVGRWALKPAQGGEGWKPSGLMERVSIFVEGHALPPSGKSIEEGVFGKAIYVRQARDRLVKDGYLREIEDGQARRFESLNPYREADDPDLNEPRPDSSLNGTTLSPEPLEPTSSPRPPSIGDEDEDEGSTSSRNRPEDYPERSEDSNEPRADW